jgi:hypothetical protein
MGNLLITMQTFHGERLCAGALLPQDSLRHIEILQRCENFEPEVIAPAREIAPNIFALRKRNYERLESFEAASAFGEMLLHDRSSEVVI